MSLRVSWIIASTILTASILPLHAEDPSSKPVRFDLDAALKAKPPAPVNGVLLKSANAEVSLVDEQATIRFELEYEYRGRRWPLVIHRPNLELADSGQTIVDVVAQGISGKAYVVVLKSPRPLVAEEPEEKEWFLTISEAAKSGKCRLSFPLAASKAKFIETFPDEFLVDRAPKLFVRLRMNIINRGHELQLDAWTGKLSGPLLPVKATKW